MKNYNQMPPRYHRRHHYFLDTLAIIILLVIGAGGAYILSPNSSNTTQQSSQQTSPNNSESDSNTSSNKNTKGGLATKIKDKVSSKVNTVKDKVEHKPNQPTTRPGYTLAAFPKDIQGTWYSLDKYSNGEGKKLDKIVITTTTISESNSPTITLHSRSKHSVPNSKPNNTNKDWCVAVTGNFKGIPLTNVRGWSQTAGDGADYGFLNINGIDVLDLAGGAGVATDANYFHTPAQAKKFANKTFHGEHRDDI